MLRPRPAAELIPWDVLRTDLRAHRDAIVRDWVALLDGGEGERACVDFLNEHAGFFFCDSIQRLLAISELELGADLRPDFVVSTDMASYGLYYEFIEIEDPNVKPVTSKGQFSARLNGAVVDVSDFLVKKHLDDRAPPQEQVRAVAEAVNFRSREASPAPVNSPKKRAGRVHRTGRNVQFNIKASQETVEAFYALTEEHPGWVLGYTLERAIAALTRELETEA